ncbi:hypothetical protein R9X47_02015 [Wukongibacter baidiensis]|uniref:hypothetical protein n=1 Tax=Wukongibacter baidiensis TaxID=1723361 RepID=UPI003D7FD654
MRIPDLIGIKLEDISGEIENLKNFYNITIRETASPFKSSEYKKNECRVVRQQNFDNTIIITVSYI